MVHHEPDRCPGLIGIGLHGHVVPAGIRDGDPLRHAVERVGGGEVEELDVGVIELQDAAEADRSRVGDAIEILRDTVVDVIQVDRRRRPDDQRGVQSGVSGGEIALDMERRHRLVGGDGVEPARVGLGRQTLAQLFADLLVHPDQIRDGVAVLETGQPAQRRALITARRHARVGQGQLQRGERGVNNRSVRLGRRRRGHLPSFEPLVDFLPGRERLAVRQVVPEIDQVERGDGAHTVATHARLAHKRTDVFLQRLGRRGPGTRKHTDQNKNYDPVHRLSLSSVLGENGRRQGDASIVRTGMNVRAGPKPRPTRSLTPR